MPDQNPLTVYPFAIEVFMLIAMFWVIISGKKYSFTTRIVTCFIISAIVIIILPFLAEIGGTTAFWLVFIDLLIFGIISGVLRATVYSLAAALPFPYMGALMFGTGVSGIFTNVLRGLSFWLWPMDESANNNFYAIVAYCSMAAFFLILCAMS